MSLRPLGIYLNYDSCVLFFSFLDDGLTIGAAVTISEFQVALIKAVEAFDVSLFYF